MHNRRTLIAVCVKSLGSEPISLDDKASVDICGYNTVFVANNTFRFNEIISVRFAKYSIFTSKSIRIDAMSLKDQSPLPYSKLRPELLRTRANWLIGLFIIKFYSTKGLIRHMLSFLLRGPKQWSEHNISKCKITYELYEHFAKGL